MKIEQNIPLPKHTTGRPPKYPFRDMEVNDSIEFKEGTVNASRAAYMYGQRNDKKFTAIMTDGVLRIWRTE